MLVPEPAKDEPERLQTLHNLHILDTDTEERFDRITRIATHLFNVPIALVSLIDDTRQWIKSAEGLDVKETARETSFCGHTILTDEITVVEDARKDKRFHDNPYVLDDPNVRFYLGCPLKVNTHNVGSLCLIDDKPRHFKKKDINAMRDLADMVELELKSVHLSTTDELTGLSNRRGFLMIANHALKLLERHNQPFTLLFFDLDKFKQINDTYGHAEGDEVLKHFTHKLLKYFRQSDVVARLGGDEFCVACSGMSQKDIEKVLKNFNKALNQGIDKTYKIQYSVGAIEYNKMKHHSLAELISDADAKMYHDKKIKG